MGNNVAIVFSDDYSDQLDRLSFRVPVWIADTFENRSAAELAWRAAQDWPHISVTLFRSPGPHATREDWHALIEQIALQERAMDVVEVIGSPLTVPARSVLGDAGFTRFEETPEGFRAKK